MAEQLDRGSNVEHPSRYRKGGIEVWDVERAFAGPAEVPHFVEHLRFGAVEYLLRCWDKNGVEDIRKAAFLLSRMQEEMAKTPSVKTFNFPIDKYQ